MKLKLFDNLLLLRVIKPGNRTPGGLYIPEMALDGTPWQIGQVIAASAGWHNAMGMFIEMPVKVDDVLLFFRQSKGQVVFPVGDEEHLFIRFSDVGAQTLDLDTVSSLTGIDGQPLVLRTSEPS